MIEIDRTGFWVFLGALSEKMFSQNTYKQAKQNNKLIGKKKKYYKVELSFQIVLLSIVYPNKISIDS